MSNYILDVASQKGKIDWPGAIQRSDAFPLDRSSVFSSLADAEAYVQGLKDSRGLSATSYAGQFISVYDENTKQIRPYLVQGIFNAEGTIIGRSLKELFLEDTISSFYIDGGNAEQAEAEYLMNLN